MALIGFQVPADAGALLERADVPGDKHSASDFHITSVYTGGSSGIVDVAKAIVVVQRVCEAFGPFAVTLSDISSFPGGDDGVPVICQLDSPELHSFHQAVKAGLDGAGVSYSKKWPEYRPHVTLSYVKDGSAREVTGSLPSPVTFILYKAFVWGDPSSGMVRADLPFSGSPIAVMAARMASCIG